MSTVRNPVGPQPASVYWRRRILVLLGLAAVVVVIVLIIVRPGTEGARQPTPTATPSTTAVAGEEGEPCNPAVVRVDPVTDANSYAAGVNPMISMTITNTGSVACTFDVGTAAQAYFIVSGTDPIWNSRDCQQNAESFEMTLEPNTPVSTTPFPWDRTRSDPSTCTAARPTVIANGATYRLSVTLGDVESASDVPFILE